MSYLCPIDNTKYETNVTECKVCGFTDELGIDRIWPLKEDAYRWMAEEVFPYARRYWGGRLEEANREIERLKGDAKPDLTLAKIGDKIEFGRMDWLVLDRQGSKMLILSENIIEKRAYNEKKDKITWADCTLREYLNKYFYYNFSQQDRARVAEAEITTHDNPWYGIKGGNTVNDRVFLLSIEEAVRYFGDSGDLKNRKGWHYENKQYVLKDEKGQSINDQYNVVRKAKYANGTGSYWWLRSPGIDGLNAAFVNGNGSLAVSGLSVDSVAGVRPALWLNL